jgi:hypothetical protein
VWNARLFFFYLFSFLLFFVTFFTTCNFVNYFVLLKGQGELFLKKIDCLGGRGAPIYRIQALRV